MNKLKFLFFACTIFHSTNNIFAEDLQLKINGLIEIQGGILNSDAPSGSKAPIDAKGDDKFGTKIGGNIALNISKKLDSGIKFGAQIGLNTTIKSTRKSTTFIFVEHEGGKVEYGSNLGAAGTMALSASKACSDPGPTCWNNWIVFDPLGTGVNKIPFLSCTGQYLDTRTRTSGETEFSRKLTYYTPKLRGFQFGISFVPDASNAGYASLKDTNFIEFNAPTYPGYSFTIKDGISLGLSYEKETNSDFKYKLSIVGETGKVKNFHLNNTTKNVRNLGTISFGAQIDYKKFSFATSYTDHLKSLTEATDTRRNSNIFTIGASYKFNKLKTNLSHYYSNHRQNKLNATTLSIEYKLAAGILPYASIIIYDAQGTSIGGARSLKTKGNLVIVGTKLTF